MYISLCYRSAFYRLNNRLFNSTWQQTKDRQTAVIIIETKSNHP